MAQTGESAATPQLRFPEFRATSAWTTTELDKLAEPVTERVGASECTPYTVMAGVGLVSQQEKLGRTIAGKSLQNYIVLQRDDFAFNKSATKAYPQGFIGRYLGDERAAVPGSIFTCFRADKAVINPAYLDYLFSSNLHGRWLRKFIAVGARAHGSLNVNDDDLMRLPIPVPSGAASLQEQRKIVDCLTSLDDSITAQAQKVEALKVHKRGLMQRLFPHEGETVPRLRFPEFRDEPRWDETSAGSLFANRAERGEAGLPIYSVTMHDGMVRRSSLDRDFSDIEDPAGNKKACKGDIAYNTMRMWQGALGVAGEDCLVSPAYVVLKPANGVVSEFFTYLFKLPSTLRLLTSHSRGLTKDRLRLYYDDFARVPLRCPNPAEQRRIAECLLSIDVEIATESAKLDSLRQHKASLMQQLFALPKQDCADA